MHVKLSFVILNLSLYFPLGRLLMIHLNLFEQHDVNSISRFYTKEKHSIK